MTTHTRTVLKERQLHGKTWEGQKTWESLKQTVLVEGPDTVSIYENTLTEGISVNGKPWKRWSLDSAVFFSMRGTYEGKPVLKVFRKKKYRAPGAARMTTSLRDVTKTSGFTAGYVQNVPEVREAVLKLVAAKTSKDIEEIKKSIPTDGRSPHPLFGMAFPLFTHWDNAVATVGIPHMRSDNINDFTQKLFGKTRYRKDLVKAVANCPDPDLLKNAYELRGLVPIDWIIRYLRESAEHHKPKKSRGISYHTPMKIHNLREGFKKMTPAQRKSLFPVLLDVKAHTRYEIEDTMRSIDKLPEETVHSVKMKASELRRVHDELAAEVRKLREANLTIPVSALAKKIKEVTFDGISVVPASNTHEVIGWGKDMNHCIASYNRHAVSKERTLVGIYKDGNLIGNASFRADNTCEQAFGKNNQRMPEEVLESLKAGLEGVVNFKGAWGVDKNSYF